jgi:neutral ceramidase
MANKKDKADNTSSGKRTTKRRRWVKRIFIIVLVVVIVLILPWPADNSTYVGSNYQSLTLARLNKKPVSSAEPRTILVGTAEVDITPPVGHPLAGHSQRIFKSYKSIHSRCYGHALTLASGSQMVTILTADLLTIHQVVSQEVLAKAGLEADGVYFTAGHTHAGPGGYVDRWIEEICIGKYNAEYFDFLTTKLAEVIKESRKELTKAQMGLLTVDAGHNLRNNIDENLPTFGKLSALVFRKNGDDSTDTKPLAVLVSYGAHPTILTQHQRYLSADYPGALVDELKTRTGTEMVMFSAGSVGQTNHAFRKPRPQERRARSEAYGKLVADWLTNNWDQIKYTRKLALWNERLQVDLPKFRITVGKRLRLNPLFTGHLLDRRTHLHVIRIGKAVLVGFPADYSSDLAIMLDGWFSERGLEFVPTSFNGDWRGYIFSSETFFKYGKYETRLMSYYGPWIGEYLNDLVKRMVERTIPSQETQ